jgi:hypothetical protein
MKPIILAALSCLALAACAAPPETAAQQSENAACTAQADAQYQQDTVDQEGRTLQNGLRYGATPTQVFGAETMGAQSQREHQIQDCEETGNNNGQPVVNGVPVVTPHIITN